MAHTVQKIISAIVNPNEAVILDLQDIVKKISQREPFISGMSDQELKNKTAEFRARLKKGETLDDLLIEAYAVMREVSKRVINRRAYEVQLMGAIVLHRGMVDEQKTGEGKTIVAMLPTYLNALAGKGVHVITVNDYLAARDRDFVAPAFEALGMSIGVITQASKPAERHTAYNCDITYGTSTEFGFDYLRDNMATEQTDKVQRGHFYVILDEIDNILIDEARTPLIISQPMGKASNLYQKFAKIAPKFRRKRDFTLDEKTKGIVLTEKGIKLAEKLLEVKNFYSAENVILVHHLEEAMKAEFIFKHDIDYVIFNKKVMIVDENTGRLQFGKRYSGGLHQAIEAKEGVKVGKEDQTIASVTFQNYFKLYKKLSGMTGTGYTAAEEFFKVFGMRTVIVPTHKPVIRKDLADSFFKNESGKFTAVAREIQKLYQSGRPVLVGASSVEKSELLSEIIKGLGIPHQVLNAKMHKKEAKIVEHGGEKNSVIISTAMAGRGTDIKLAPGVRELGGLAVLGTERAEDRRIDDQLRGRAGRQGDPGSSQFFVSMDDALLHRFAPEETVRGIQALGIPEDQPIENPILPGLIADAQKRVAGIQLEARQYTLDFDGVVNVQRLALYHLRDRFISQNSKKLVYEMLKDLIMEVIRVSCRAPKPQKWVWSSIFSLINALASVPEEEQNKLMKIRSRVELGKGLFEIFKSAYEDMEKTYPAEELRRREKTIGLMLTDKLWTEHLYSMDTLQDAVALLQYVEIQPLAAYKDEGYELWKQVLRDLHQKIVYAIFRGNLG